MIIEADAAEDRFWRDVFPGVAAKAVEREPELAERIAEYSVELRRFLELAKQSHVPLAMISVRVDSLWHEFVNHTITYRDYCQRIAGKFLDHMPRSDWFPISDDAIPATVSGYEARFGRLPDCWFDGMDSNVADQLRNGQNPQGMKWSGFVP